MMKLAQMEQMSKYFIIFLLSYDIFCHLFSAAVCGQEAKSN